MKPFLLILAIILVASCSQETYLQKVQISHTDKGVKISPVGDPVPVNSETCPNGITQTILIRK